MFSINFKMNIIVLVSCVSHEIQSIKLGNLTEIGIFTHKLIIKNSK